MKNELEISILAISNIQKFVIGNDLVYLPFFSESFSDHFKLKVYTENEIAYCEQFDQPMLRYASTFSAKEAVYKAFKQIHEIPIVWKKIEILRENIAGKPKVKLHIDTIVPNISLTISHDGDYAWAIALIEHKL